MSDTTPTIKRFPPAAVIRDRLGDALREVELLRGLLKLAERVDHYRELDARQRPQVVRHA